MAVGSSRLGFHQLAWQQVLAQGCRWERPSLCGAQLRSWEEPLAPFLPGPHGTALDGRGSRDPHAPASTAQVAAGCSRGAALSRR